jgi:hypothetical protein
MERGVAANGQFWVGCAVAKMQTRYKNGVRLFGCRVGCSRAKFLVLVLARFRVSVGLGRYVVGSVRIEEKRGWLFVSEVVVGVHYYPS